METLDILIKNACVVTMDHNRSVLTDSAIAISGATIKAMGLSAEIGKKYHARKIIDASGKYVFPGLINTHSHLFQTLLKGLGRDMPLMDWLDSSVRPALSKMGFEDLHTAAMVGCMENIRSGCTTVLDYQYAHGSGPRLDDAVLQAFEGTGIRGVLGRSHTDVSQFAAALRCPRIETEQEFFDDVTRLVAKTQEHPCISVAIAPGSIRDLSEEGFRHCRTIADRYGLLLTMHALESPHDNAFSNEKFGDALAPFLERTGVLGPDFLAVHCIQMDEEAFELFKDHGVKVSHNPVSNMILGSGVAPVARMHNEGMTVSLGTDGSASNDSQDMLETLKISALLQKGHNQDPALMPADVVLQMATRGGAECLGRLEDIGSLEQGKRADLWIMDPMTVHCAPVADPVTALVYHSSQGNAETVIVNGQVVLEAGQFTMLDEERIIRKLQSRSNELRKAAGLLAGLPPKLDRSPGKPQNEIRQGHPGRKVSVKRVQQIQLGG